MHDDSRPCRQHAHRAGCAGFTLIELMVVVAILGLLATLVATSVIPSAEVAKEQKAAVDCAQIAGAAKIFFIERGRTPSLADLTSREHGRPYLDGVPKDPWGGDYQLIASDDPPDFEVRSRGRNKIEGDDDDVSSKPGPD